MFKKITFQDVGPHLAALAIFVAVTLAFFSPAFFENKELSQGDIAQHIGSSHDLAEYRETHGEEGLWAGSVFGGMPAYLISVDWSDEAVVLLKKVLSLFFKHPYCNFFLGFVCFYILGLSFGVRPWLSIAGALAFGLSSYLIIGLVAGHNSRIGAAAFMPLVLAGIHLTVSGRRLLGAGVTAAGMALHLRENHLQMTYYLLLMVLLYGLIMLIKNIREGQLMPFIKSISLLVAAVVLAVFTFFGQFWSISEFTKYSYRGSSELVNPGTKKHDSGLSKEYAFMYSNGIGEPMTLLFPNFYGGSSSDMLFTDAKSATYQALMQSGSQETANQLAPAARAYWGPQPLAAPYYGGILFFLLAVVGIFWADRHLTIWLIASSVIAIVLSWGDHAASINYFLYDYLPGYNKFRSVTFSIIMVLIAMPLLGLLGLEKILQTGWSNDIKKKLIYPALAVVLLCLLMCVPGVFLGFLRPEEMDLPVWFTSALVADRTALLISDGVRALILVSVFTAGLLMFLKKWISQTLWIAAVLVIVLVDMAPVASRFIRKENYQASRQRYSFPMDQSEKEVLRDTTNFRVYAEYDGRPSYYFRSTGGYSGARLRRYQELMDSLLRREWNVMTDQYRQSGSLFMPRRSIMSMLNVKYFINGPGTGEYFTNPYANGPAWFVRSIEPVSDPNEELEKTGMINTRETAVINTKEYTLSKTELAVDSTATVQLNKYELPQLVYTTSSAVDGLVVFSEIHYPVGWKAFIDGKEAEILRANYVLRALEVPAGQHRIEFKFAPAAYHVGNKVTMIASWLLLGFFVFSLVMTLRKK